MSTHLFLLFLLLLSLYAHACNGARHHGRFHMSSSRKGEEEVKFTKTKLKTMYHEPISHQQKQPINREGQIGDKGYAEPPPSWIMDEPRRMITRGVLVRSDHQPPISTVSWKIPHEKHAGHLRFDLDYSPPKTHPPVHN